MSYARMRTLLNVFCAHGSDAVVHSLFRKNYDYRFSACCAMILAEGAETSGSIHYTISPRRIIRSQLQSALYEC